VSDLFENRGQFRRLEMPDADVSYLADFDLGVSHEQILNRLIAAIPWRTERIILWGKSRAQPRLSAWFGDPAAKYRYSGVEFEPLPWTEDLLSMKTRAERAAQASFNSVLLNYYRDKNDSMGMHSDDERELGDKPVIASLSLGDRRTLIFKHKTRPAQPPIRVPLQSGSLLLMKGETQKNWKHGIRRESRPCGPRVNLTFRRIYPGLSTKTTGALSKRSMNGGMS
jgi:alkylated DNA repair dioxygenase AlkB